MKMKRIKLDVSHTDILHCLLVLLNKIFDNVDFCELKSLVWFCTNTLYHIEGMMQVIFLKV